MPLVVVTFNTGTTEGMAHDDGDDGYTSEHAEISDTWYGDGLAWLEAIDAVSAFFDDNPPDIVAFQEIFDPAECADIPPEFHAEFVCSEWSAGDPTVAEQVLGDDYVVQCFPGNSDKCLAVHRRHGDLGPLIGEGVDGCGSGARVARGQVDGLTIVGVHGSSGFSSEEMDCRVQQVEQAFDGLEANALVLGDFNTDPGRQAETDPSAQAWVDHVVDPWHFVSPVGPDAPGSYAGLADIDHVVADTLEGDCWHAGIDTDAVLDATYFDHLPVVCSVTE